MKILKHTEGQGQGQVRTLSIPELVVKSLSNGKDRFLDHSSHILLECLQKN